MALGLILCALVNVLLGFSNSFYAYVGLLSRLGFFKVWG
ncbi:phosphoglycerate transporter [Campylobacter jejuni]